MLNARMLFAWCLQITLGSKLDGEAVAHVVGLMQHAPPGTQAMLLDGSGVRDYDIPTLQAALPDLSYAQQRGISRIILVTTEAFASMVAAEIEAASGAKTSVFESVSDAERWLRAGCPA